MQASDELAALWLQFPKIDEIGLIDSCDLVEELGLVAPDTVQYSSKRYVLVDNKLGVFRSTLAQLSSEVSAQRPQILCAHLENTEKTTRFSNLSRAAILLVGMSNHTLLNTRKSLLVSHHIDPAGELHLFEVAFSFPHNLKSVEGWAHFHWLFKHCLEHGCVPRDELLARSLAVCSRAAELRPRNYYSWTHMTCFVLPALDLSRCLEEIGRVNRWVSRRPSDHSAQHHLTQVFQQLSRLSILPVVAPEQRHALARKFCDQIATITTLSSDIPFPPWSSDALSAQIITSPGDHLLGALRAAAFIAPPHIARFPDATAALLSLPSRAFADREAQLLEWFGQATVSVDGSLTGSTACGPDSLLGNFAQLCAGEVLFLRHLRGRYPMHISLWNWATDFWRLLSRWISCNTPTSSVFRPVASTSAVPSLASEIHFTTRCIEDALLKADKTTARGAAGHARWLLELIR
ncbi:putative protein prenyltransferase alpha subunit repeat containing protein 1 [Paratrimastix pyriformis]|uniref:Uncharacterized protein n=1 Tax=Paratrimastix pyriformis TaxID=342808 RepID=A0ABQ8V039_9EUKA|nr:putative protein prenyltransferase alpha subunit repeat containing protein 1 [Paratrimastix pyriformis]